MGSFQAMLQPTSLFVSRIQIALLALISVLIIRAVPDSWNYSPDAGVYVASALSLIEDGRYWFNGYPNLLYYPGTSVLLAVPISLFGLDWQILHMFFALFGVTAIWLARITFPAARYGWIGVLTPAFLGLNSLVVDYSMQLMSDMVFINIVLLSVYSWQRFVETRRSEWFWICLLVVALSPMFRFQGLFLIASFGLALIWLTVKDGKSLFWGNFRLVLWSSLALVPFVVWTARNYVLHTPETYNMANTAFFGLTGMPISGPGFGVPDWIDAEWKYPVYQLIYLFGDLAETFFDPISGEWRPLAALGMMGMLAVGFVRWSPSAGVFAGVFVVANIFLLVNKFIGGQSLHIITRYWMPALPFVIVIAGMSLRQLLELVEVSRVRHVLLALLTLCLFALLASGVYDLVQKGSAEEKQNVRERYRAAERVTEYVRENIPKGTLLVSSEWGVAPVLTERQSYQISRSPCMRYTLQLIMQKEASYLVVLPGVLRVPFALELVSELPDVFNPVFEVGALGDRTYAAVYSIARGPIPRVIEEIRCAWD